MVAAGMHALVRRVERSDGPAAILAIGTANPPNVFDQDTYADYYFRITSSDHRTELKEKFRRICAKTTVKKRYMHLTEEILKDHPNICAYMAPSLDDRQDLLVEAVPKLGMEAAVRAIEEWGRPRSDITHIIFCAMVGVDMPGADYQLLKLLGLPPTVNRLMLYHTGCYAGGTGLRIAKDIAENNKNARVLLVCSEITVHNFRGPDDHHFHSLASQAIFGDGAAAVIIGADPVRNIEKPVFEIVSAAQVVLPNSEGAVIGRLREVGLTFQSVNQLPEIIAKNLEKTLLIKTFERLGISDWNELFWIAHPGGPGVLDKVQEELRLRPEKLRASRNVLSEYGNMSSCTVLFIMEEMRRRSAEEGLGTTGEGLEYGALYGFGPGLTVEMVVLRSMPI